MKMVRSLVLAASIASAAALGGCSSTGQIINPFTQQPISTADVQAAAVAACGFLPTASSVAQVISAAASGSGSSQIATATAVASQICAAVLPKAGKLRGAPMVNGVVVHGRFVN